MNSEELLDFDRHHIWHPYASMKNPIGVYEVVDARGVYLTLSDGRRVIDGMSSWWSVAYGYNNPHINAAVAEQMGRFAHVMFGGLTHAGAVKLAKRLIGMAPKPLDKIFFCDSGSVCATRTICSSIFRLHAELPFAATRTEKGKAIFLL